MLTVNALPTPSIAGLTKVCANSTDVYTTQAGMSIYQWIVTGDISYTSGGTSDNTITINWGAAGIGHIKLNYTYGNGCTAIITTDSTITINPLPAPSIAGPINVCTNSIGNTYTTESGMSNYQWIINGGAITSGGSPIDNTVTVLGKQVLQG